jgi:redox-sensitive bicupin YhaK (pirin superfamily)
MSGPVDGRDLESGRSAGLASADVAPAEPILTESRPAQVGAVHVRRALPTRGRRTVGAWCFADHFGPAEATEEHGFDVGPHPHMGLQTVTWLLEGEVLHRDSLGTEQVIRPGQLNLMTAGQGVAHSEEATGRYRGPLHGVQLWVAQPAETREGPAGFEHHPDLPAIELGGCTATVLVGSLAGTRSPARTDTEHFGADLVFRPGPAEVPVGPADEHALVVFTGVVTVEGTAVEPGHLAYLGPGRDSLSFGAPRNSRALLLGGRPFPEPVLMWWNFVARSRDEVDVAWRDWESDTGRFGTVASPLSRIRAGRPVWMGASAN